MVSSAKQPNAEKYWGGNELIRRSVILLHWTYQHCEMMFLFVSHQTQLYKSKHYHIVVVNGLNEMININNG